MSACRECGTELDQAGCQAIGVFHTAQHCVSALQASLEALTEERDYVRAKFDDAIRVACAASNDAERALREAEIL